VVCVILVGEQHDVVRKNGKMPSTIKRNIEMSNLAVETTTTTQNTHLLTGEIIFNHELKVKEYKKPLKLGHYYSILQDANEFLWKLTGQQRKIFDLLCCMVKYDSNRVDLNTTIRAELSTEVGISVGSFNNQVCKLKKLGVLKSIGRDSFMLNPSIVFMCSRARAVELRPVYLNLK
jgi:hypothetical protein